MSEKLTNPHPGEILREEYLQPLEMTPYRLAKALRVQPTRVAEILAGRRSISADTALRLGRLFRTSPQFWLNLQAAYDLEEAEEALTDELAQIEPWPMPHLDEIEEPVETAEKHPSVAA